ncbi:MAG TPA: PEP-CTERM sorting domain-containing protein [Tepidisphaeraceae bacterium]|nr:PEP-CTERM sorting domain-containing protein [Tepidisphaeraceae bacterium]
MVRTQLLTLVLSAGAALSFAHADLHGAVMTFSVPDQTLGSNGPDNGTYTEAGFQIREHSFTGINIDQGLLQDGGWGGDSGEGGGFEMTSTIPGELFSLVSFDGKTRYGNPPSVTVRGYDAADFLVGSAEVFTLAGTMATYTLPASFTSLSRVTFSNQSDPEFDNITLAAAAVPEPTTLGLLSVGAMGLLARRRCAAV